jgi:hypothetical protein
MEDAPRSEEAAPGLPGRLALPLVCAAACVLFVAGAILFYFGPAFASYFNSDAAVPALLANEVLRTGRLVPSTWYFGNDEIWILSPHLFTMPFVAAFGVSTLALKLGNLLCLGTMVSLLAVCVHRVTRSWPYAILVTAGVFAAFSGFQEGAVYSQTAYGWFTALFALLIHLALRIQSGAGDSWRLGDVRWSLGLYVLVLAALAAESSVRAAAYWVVPLVTVTLAFPISKTRSRALAGWTIGALLAGALIHHVILQHVLSAAGLSANFLKPPSEWRLNLLRIWVGLPGVTGWVQAPYASIPGALDRFRFCLMAFAGLVVLIAPAGDGPGSAECRFFARVSGVMLLVVLVALTIGRLNVDPGSDRYLVPPALLSLASFMAIVWCRLRANTWAITSVAAIFVLVFCGSAVILVSRSGPLTSNRPCEAPANVCQLTHVLATTDIRQGYATYWKANATTLVSAGRSRVCGVLLKPRVVPFRWLTPRDCFDPPTEPRYFLALDRAEIAAAGRDFLVSQEGTPDEIVKGGAYEIWIYTTANAKLDWLRGP